MNKNIKTICIFASSSNLIDEKYRKHAHELGELIAKNGYNIIYGGSNRGLMGIVTKTAFQLGANVVGVMPEMLRNMGIEEGNCSEFIVTKGMRERKAKMDEMSQCVIALSGGFGTLEELSEMIVQKQLGYNSKPIVLLNTDGYYDKLSEFFNKMIDENFAPKECSNLYFCTDSVQKALDYINNYEFVKVDYIKEKLAIK